MLDISMEFKRGILFVRLKGILNGDTSPNLGDELSNVVKENGIKYLLINLNEIEYIDKYGVDVIIQNYLMITANQGKMIICGIEKLFKCNVNPIDNLYQINEEDAVFELIKI